MRDSYWAVRIANSDTAPINTKSLSDRKEDADGDSDENYDSSCRETFERVRMSST